MSDDLLIRPFAEGDEAAVRRLFRLVFEKDMSEETQRWKYGGGPGAPPNTMLCFDTKGELIVYYAAIVLPGRFCGCDRLLGQPVDIMSHPEHRGVGMGPRNPFVRTAEAFFDTWLDDERTAVFFGFPGERHFRLGKLLLNYEGVGEPPYLVGDLPPAPWWKRYLPSRPRRGVRRMNRFGEFADELWAKAAEGYPWCVARTGRYLDWRYVDNPDHTYRLYGLSERGKPVAIAVTSVEGETVRIMELFSPIDVPPERLDGLLAKILADAVRAGTRRVEAWMPESAPARTTLLHAGLAPAPEPNRLVTNAGPVRDERMKKRIAEHPFYHTMGDADIF